MQEWLVPGSRNAQGKTGVRFRVCYRTRRLGEGPDTGEASRRSARHSPARRGSTASSQRCEFPTCACSASPSAHRRSPKRPSGGARAASTWPSPRASCTASRSIACCRFSAPAASTRSRPPMSRRSSPSCTRPATSAQTIRKSLTVPRAGARPRRHPAEPGPRPDQVKLPREEREELEPPTASHVAAVYRTVPSVHRLPLLFLDWSGARVKAIDTLLVGDYDEPGGRVRLRAATTKTRRALWVELHPDLAEALSAALGPREDRDPDARLFAASGSDALRTSIAKACRALGIPLWSPHDLRHRRISLLHLRASPGCASENRSARETSQSPRIPIRM